MALTEAQKNAFKPVEQIATSVPKDAIAVSPVAVEAIRAALAKRGTPEAALRIGIRGGGCSGFSYAIEYEDAGVVRVGEFVERVRVSAVSGRYFDLLGLKPAAGRLFTDADTDPAAAPIAVISHSLWKRGFDGSPTALGATLTLNGRHFTIVGIAPAVTEPSRQVTIPALSEQPPWLGVAVTKVTPAGSVSVTRMAVAVGPLLITTRL